MSNNSVENLLEERADLTSELGSFSHLLHGSWVERFSVCSRPQCKCHSGEKHGPRRYLVVREKGKQRQKYIPNSQVNAAIKGRDEYKRLCEVVERITQINLLLMKEDAYKN
jgi:hypothetical protein